jgi:hypothetical protein
MARSLARVRNWVSSPLYILVLLVDLTIASRIFCFDFPCTTLRSTTWYVFVSYHHDHTLMPFYGHFNASHAVRSLAGVRNWASAPFHIFILSVDLTIVSHIFCFDFPCTTLHTTTWYVFASYHHDHTLTLFRACNPHFNVTHLARSLARARNWVSSQTPSRCQLI